ncbi:MFS transporter, partial [Aeromonas dhakensis]
AALAWLTARTPQVHASGTPPAPQGSVLAIPGALGALLAMGLGLGGGIGLFNLVGQHLHDSQGLPVWSVGLLYGALGVISVVGNVLMPRLAGYVESGRPLMRGALVVCALVSAFFYLYPAGSLASLALPLGLWALAGGIGSPALQGYIAQLAPAQRGMLMSLAMTLMHLGVALWSAVAGFAYSAGPMAMALLALLLFGGAILALRPVRLPG